MAVKTHSKSRRDLMLMNVSMLKDMVRKHNLDNAIKRYSSMRKADLVDALMKHSSKPNLVIVKEEKPAPKPAAKKAAAKPAAKPAAKKRKLEIVKKRKLEIVKNETPAERAARRAKPRVYKGIPIAKANLFDTKEEMAAYSAAQVKFRKERREKREKEEREKKK